LLQGMHMMLGFKIQTCLLPEDEDD
jgi:hypothetical protein